MTSEQAGRSRSRMVWWLAIPVAIVAFGIAYGITKLTSGDSGGEVSGPPPGITFAQGHAVPLHIGEQQFSRRITQPPLFVQRRNTHPPQTCRYYRLTDQPGQYVFCFARGRLVVAYGGPTQ